MPKKINLTGTTGKTYDLEELANSDTRTSSSENLIVQVWKWNPNLEDGNPHKEPNPSNLQIGQIWLSKLVSMDSDDYKALQAYNPSVAG